jgi:hypothetical protein
MFTKVGRPDLIPCVGNLACHCFLHAFYIQEKFDKRDKKKHRLSSRLGTFSC